MRRLLLFSYGNIISQRCHNSELLIIHPIPIHIWIATNPNIICIGHIIIILIKSHRISLTSFFYLSFSLKHFFSIPQFLLVLLFFKSNSFFFRTFWLHFLCDSPTILKVFRIFNIDNAVLRNSYINQLLISLRINETFFSVFFLKVEPHKSGWHI